MFLRFTHAEALIAGSLTSLLNSIPSYKHAIIYLFIFLLMDVEVSDFSILQILKTIYISPYVCE
jgi:hypothetical protein